MIVGIDPGFYGAISFLDETGGIEVYDMPVFLNQTKKPTGLNLLALGNMLSPTLDNPHIAVIENVGPHPKDGKDRVFKFGRQIGNLEMAVAGLGYDVRWVTPPVWKKHFKLTSDKKTSRQLASQRFPDIADQFMRVKDDGRAEAALLALYGKEVLTR